MNLLLIVVSIFSIPFIFIALTCKKLFLLFNLSFISFIFGDFAEFFYKVVLYPYFVVYLEGFFDYYGKYSLFSHGYSAVTINQSLYFTDVKDVFYSKKSYMSAQKR
jgi:hypothetical protein